MANHEIQLILARILFKFDLEIGDGNEDWDDQKAFVLWEKRPLMVRLALAAVQE
jgi:hypothetical protein